MIRIRLLGNSVHLYRLKPANQSQGGIYFDMSRQDDERRYHVLGVGPGKRMKDGTVRPIEVRPGQNVLIPYLQDAREFDDGTLVANADQIWAVWEPEK